LHAFLCKIAPTLRYIKSNRLGAGGSQSTVVGFERPLPFQCDPVELRHAHGLHLSPSSAKRPSLLGHVSTVPSRSGARIGESRVRRVSGYGLDASRAHPPGGCSKYVPGGG